MWMPSLISLMVMDLDSSKSWFSSVPVECVRLEELSKWLHALGASKGDGTKVDEAELRSCVCYGDWS